MNLPTEYQAFIALSRYARWLPKEKRRETWEETVQRYIAHFEGQISPMIGGHDEASLNTMAELEQSILNLDVMPSMRALMTGGVALERDNVAGFNCSYLAMNRQRAFDELMYILMCGTGVGFSCEKDEVDKLPSIAEELFDSATTIVVSDSKIGWASAFRELISLLYAGKIPRWDLSRVRKAGEPLKTFGGRASGPAPLDELFKYSVNTFVRFRGKKLSELAVHDLVCKIAEIVVVGGVRRSALISLSSLDSKELRLAKSPFTVKEYTLLDHTETGDRKYSVIVDDFPYGERSVIVKLNDWESGELQSKHQLAWYHVHPERGLANNSVAYESKPNMMSYIREWTSLVESYSGERGIFNREASSNQASKNGRRDGNYLFGTNPCSEIILRDRQFCNLSEVVVRAGDTFNDLKRKVRIAAILGTLQATQTNFRYLGKAWKDNTEEEALLGVSLTGIMDHPILSGSATVVMGDSEDEHIRVSLSDWLEELKAVAIETNKEWAEKLGINQSVAITCVKPSGTVSQLVDSASGIHTRHSDYYIRTVRADKKDPLAKFMVDAGFPVEDDHTKPNTTHIFSFPIKSPDGSITRDSITAIQQLELWLTYQRHWCEHKPSVTINVKDDDWMEAGAWVYKHFDEMSGVSFLPHDGGSYKQAPYQEIDEEAYIAALESMPKAVDWSKVGEYEDRDNTIGSQELACTGGACDIVDIDED